MYDACIHICMYVSVYVNAECRMGRYLISYKHNMAAHASNID